MNSVEVSGVEVTVVVVHLEWFGDPSIQTAYIAQYFQNLSGPAVLLGDFNLEADGSNRNSPNISAWDVLLDEGWQPTTSFECHDGAQGDKDTTASRSLRVRYLHCTCRRVVLFPMLGLPAGLDSVQELDPSF